PDDLVDLAASVMDWRHVRHVPVEDDQGHLVGLITHRALLHLLSKGMSDAARTVREVMITNPLTVSSSTPTLEAMELMQSNGAGCLRAVAVGGLVGLLTSYDLLAGAARIFREHLKKPAQVKAQSA